MIGPKAVFAFVLASAVAAGSTLAFAAPPLPGAPGTQASVVKVNDHHKKSHKNWNRPQSPQPQRRKNNNDALAVGVGIAAVLGVLALSQQAKSDDGMYRECRRLRWKCREGRGWACRKFDDVCR